MKQCEVHWDVLALRPGLMEKLQDKQWEARYLAYHFFGRRGLGTQEYEPISLERLHVPIEGRISTHLLSEALALASRPIAP